MANPEALRQLMKGLMEQYRARVPDVDRIIAAMRDDGVIREPLDIENDHIAFRSLAVPHLGIQSLEKVFVHYGYQRRDAYQFEAKKLDAFWYSPPNPEFPRIFISELRVGDLSTSAQQIIHSYTDSVTEDPTEGVDFDDPASALAFLHRPLWRTPTWEDYKKLEEESEYAAWTIYNRYYLNHFTISIHNLPNGWNDIESFNAFLEKRGFKLNNSGGKTKTSPDGKLLQSSTVAVMVDAPFANGDLHRIAGSYVEFAERKVLDAFTHLPNEQIQREHRREGFEANNADRIFESTYSHQTTRD